MAGGLFDFNYEDPQQVGQSAFGAALLNAGGPSRMPVSFGQALAHGMVARQQAAAEAMQNQRRNELAMAQIEKMRSDAAYKQFLQTKGILPDTPAAIQMYEYWNKLTPKQQYDFGVVQRGAKTQTINGVTHEYMGPQLGWQPQTDLQTEAGSQGYIAGTVEQQKRLQQAGLTPREAVDPVTGRPVFSTDLGVMQGNGTVGPPPQLPANAPRLGQFPTMQQPPQQPQPQQIQQPPMFQQPVQRPVSTPDIPAGGIPPNGFSSVDEMRQFFANASGIPGAAQQVAQQAPQQAAPQALLPPSAGAAVLAGEKEAATKAADLQNKRNTEYPQAKGALESTKASIQRSLDLVDAMEKSPGAKYNTGLLSNIPIRMIKGTSAADDEFLMQSLRDKGVIQVMSNLKSLSATGSTGFGQLSEKEGVRLENAMAALQTGLTGPARDAQLKVMRDALNNIKSTAQQVFDTEYKDQSLSDLRAKYLKQ